ncbi:MAG: helix-hairpin-helix domain-containing protein [Bacteroidales bacterium]|nr:helix-hairpin-helix domain-containing protein [Bacteroidales bacterium]
MVYLTHLSDPLEIMAEEMEDEPDFNDMLDDLLYFREHPLSINTAGRDELEKLMILTPRQIHDLLAYRETYGRIFSLSELLVIPGWSNQVLDGISPFITTDAVAGERVFRHQYLWSDARFEFLSRYQRIVQKKKGYLSSDDPYWREHPEAGYLGDPSRLLVRMGYRCRDVVRAGMVAEKDPGEALLRGRWNDTIEELIHPYYRQGFDFYSGFLMIQPGGAFKRIIIGDYHLQFGQGLTLWSGFSNVKAMDVSSSRRYATGIKPRASASEAGFFRGGAVTVNWKKLDVSIFHSDDKVDARTVQPDDKPGAELEITSLADDGLHRTVSEISRKDRARVRLTGTNLTYKRDRFQAGITGFTSTLQPGIKKPSEPYKRFDIYGSNQSAMGADYQYHFRKLYLFGECATHNGIAWALLQGLMFFPDPRVSISVLFRHYPAGYRNMFQQSFGINERSANERGIYTALSLLVHKSWTLYAQVDTYRFPWLKYQVHGPSAGNEYMIKIDHHPSRTHFFYFRIRHREKLVNESETGSYTVPLRVESMTSFRVNAQYALSGCWVLRNRLEIVRHCSGEIPPAFGSLLYQDLQWSHPSQKYSASTRLAIFDTDSYHERIYAYESDNLYSYSIPAYYYRGLRCYLLVHLRPVKHLEFWFRIAQTLYTDRQQIGTGLEEIPGDQKSEWSIQMRIRL